MENLQEVLSVNDALEYIYFDYNGRKTWRAENVIRNLFKQIQFANRTRLVRNSLQLKDSDGEISRYSEKKTVAFRFC